MICPYFTAELCYATLQQYGRMLKIIQVHRIRNFFGKFQTWTLLKSRPNRTFLRKRLNRTHLRHNRWVDMEYVSLLLLNISELLPLQPKPPAPTKIPHYRCIPSPQGILKKYSRTSLLVPIKALDNTTSSTNNAQPAFESVESGSEDAMHKPRQRLNKPRMNRLTVQRIQRLQTAAS